MRKLIFKAGKGLRGEIFQLGVYGRLVQNPEIAVVSGICEVVIEFHNYCLLLDIKVGDSVPLVAGGLEIFGVVNIIKRVDIGIVTPVQADPFRN